MNQVVPASFLFRCSLRIARVDALPRKGKQLLNLPEHCRLPSLSELDGNKPFGDLRMGWNERGVGISVTVSGKSCPLSASQRNPTESDGLQIWLDSRNTHNVHRASRFCHHFCILPARTGNSGAPLAKQLPIARAREESRITASGDLPVYVKSRRDGYLLEAWFPAKALHGFDPDENAKLGFYYYLRDAELGDQFLTVGHDFPFAGDPSVWSTLELAGE